VRDQWKQWFWPRRQKRREQSARLTVWHVLKWPELHALQAKLET